MNNHHLEHNIFSHEHTIEDTIHLNSLDHMNNEHYQFQESVQEIDNDFYQKFNQVLNN